MKHITITLLLELYYVGVIEDSNILINIVIDARRQREDATQTNLTLLAGFARQGRFFLGLSYLWRKNSVKLVNVLEAQKIDNKWIDPSVLYIN